MFYKMIIAILAIFTITFISTPSFSSSEDYRCQKCKQRLSKCWQDYRSMSGIVTSQSMARTCREIESQCRESCSKNSLRYKNNDNYNKNNIPPQFNQQPAQSEINERNLYLFNRVGNYVNQYRNNAINHCFNQYGLRNFNCEQLYLLKLAEKENIEKLMETIGAKPNEYNLVQLYVNYYATF